MIRQLLTAAVAVLLLPTAGAQTVYKTVTDGVTTFSDSPPAEGAAEILTLNVPPPADDGLLEERLTAMRETTDRMADDRREREKHRAELRELQAAAQTLPSSSPVAGLDGNYWPARNGVVIGSGAFNRPGFHRPGFHRPGVRPQVPLRPGRPGTTPLPAQVAPPGWSVMQPGNSQLMRPIVSSRP